ncbi:unnamed protein product [Sphenostylis stenocarpa]|uniref:Protein kinase domain-containing protein n=1 Tax=Sphenostylis stenocarpa TaxID=92480 RepID=A0AA86S8C0_9FABA|nr:unnamed protein product [Sphenostylis stenocarpa]
MMLKITKRFRFSNFDKYRKGNGKKFSKAFKDMVASCLDQDPSKRPTADKLLKHPFFKNCKGTDFLVRNVLQGLPSVEKRYKDNKVNEHADEGEHDDDDDEEDPAMLVKERRISGWNFNQDGLELDPVFPNDDAVAKEVAFGREAAGGGGVKKEKMLATLNVLKGSLEQEPLEVKFPVKTIQGEEESDHQVAAAADHGEEHKEISRLRVALGK